MPLPPATNGAPATPFRAADAEGRALAHQLMTMARHGALAVLDPATGAPAVTRVAVGLAVPEGLYLFVSGLAAHTAALAADPRAGLLLGEPGPKGDPLTHPRLSLSVTAEPTEESQRPELSRRWLTEHPKAKLYIELADFRFVFLKITGGALNGGFGRAWKFTAADLRGEADLTP
ncbi:pyridoxamine 5-phosphate oxidase [Phaeovulum sp. W22_SRMD_FR3]|uniref:pyridoxamine 5-phosphate oxidase n=1 Tax=Phaeovulum sp. W22_SRMD_FR3 TaxID=3240274 RepID=UPI003F9A4FDF